jgi:hypothetical protein
VGLDTNQNVTEPEAMYYTIMRKYVDCAYRNKAITCSSLVYRTVILSGTVHGYKAALQIRAKTGHAQRIWIRIQKGKNDRK